MVATLAAPAAFAAPAKIKLGFLVKQPEEPWFQSEWKGAEKAATKYGFEVVKLGVTDGEKTIAAIDNLAALGATGFVICTPDVRLGPAIVAKSKGAELKVIAVDDQFVGASGKIMTTVPYLGMSASKIGHAAGEGIAGEMNKRGWVPGEVGVCVITFDQLDTIRQRTDGAVGALTAAGVPTARVLSPRKKRRTSKAASTPQPSSSRSIPTSNAGSFAAATTPQCSARCGPANSAASRPPT